MKIFPYLLIVLSISCSQRTENSQVIDARDTLVADNAADTKDTISAEEDCVFNTDYKGLTTDWLTEAKIEKFIWKEDIKEALIPRGQDTVFVSKGGCTHFGFLVEIKLTKDAHALTDTIFFLQKALELATEFKMDHFEQTIKEGKIRRTQSSDEGIWYEIDDDDPDDNMIYTGIEIIKDGSDKRVNISQYMN